MRTTKNLYFDTLLISSPSENMFTFSTLPINIVFCRFKLRPTLLLLFLTHFISSIMSSLLSTSRVVSSACVTVFIFHVTFPIPLTILSIPPAFIMYSLYRLNRPGDKMQPCLTPFWIGNHSVLFWSTCTWLLTVYVGLVLRLSNAWVFPNLLRCSTFLDSAHYQNPLC
jgi:hypothetical protein